MPPQIEASKEPDGVDRRKQARSSVRLRATVLLPDDQLLYAHTIDLSVGGACLSVPVQLLVDDECRLGLELEAVGTKHNVLLISRVCYCSPQGDGFRVGVQFLQVDPKDAALVNELLR